ncbi:tRNA (adenosine(37)-N6)-threonylcarbamoyltransferase complex dimerization subunit type 1 TsaB [Neotabrizicola sp. sgz301269]|uniref:tRNA (adenosine(37)-N6)-threonylcarbamoyltransferase complex dimerization subunit type 1 TsaB n=1 Tax=Neotabrizicola sp. sgz301269 TaxID=3276282 RepID=UPI0037700F6D
MPAILAFDSSAAHCAAALLLPDGTVLQRLEPMEKGQAERLLPFLEELLAAGDLGWTDLTALAVGTGPGNFTGIRIAVAAARGLALGLGIPAIGITALEARAFGLPRPLTVIEDARRGETYVQAFTAEGLGPAHLAPAESAPPPGALTGSAAGPSALPQPVPLAEAILRLAAQRLHRTDLPRPAPFYLRGADAAPPADPPPVILG